jgi:long-chain acyl-CoA synthetase
VVDAQLISNDRLQREGNRVARALADAGVARRGSVALLGHNTPEWLAAYRGATWSGRRLTPMSWRWSADEVAYVVGNCEAGALVIDARLEALARDASTLVPEHRRFAFGGEVEGFRPWSDIARFPDDPCADATAGATMYYTSGTTGRPKGVLKPFVEGPPPPSGGRSGMAMFERFGGTSGAHLVCTPLYHAGPLSYADGAALLGCDLLLLERFDPETVLRLIHEHAVSSTFMVPTQFVRLLRLPDAVRARYDVRSLRMVMHGSAPVAPDVKRAMIEWFGPVLYEFYGGTEGGGVAIDSHDWLQHPGSVGKPRVGLAVEILDDDLRPVPTGGEGTVWFTGGETFE